ncbi:MAG: hypothetical protein HOW73_22485 [Polyangiaceae bacterium]|nr:hypothetical protein [Polyangiaceae bacterium]
MAHYVAHHHYAPPPAFCDAVIEVAHRLPNLDANALAALAAMSPSERLDFCLDLVRASNVVGHPWATTALQALLAARPAIDPSRRKEFRAELDALYDVIVLAQDPADGPPPWLHEATKNAVQIVFAARSEETLDEDSFDLAADAIESVLEGGVDVSATMMRLT